MLRNLTGRVLAAAILAGLALVGAGRAQAEESSKLTPDDVRALFVGHEWTQGTGRFLFAEDGTWQYKDNSYDLRGSYQIGEDGTVCAVNGPGGANAGRQTCYTFYREAKGYRYWHDRSQKYYPAQFVGWSPYAAAKDALAEAGGGKACETCFLEKYGPAEFTKAFAVSRDGAYGARWKEGMPLEEAREAALESCRKKPTYTDANPCVIFFENDRLVWKP